MRVSRIDRESVSVFSLVLVPGDGQSLVAAQPGQFVVVRLNVQPGAAPMLRSCSLSDLPSTEHYRLSIKLEERGTASIYLRTRIKPGSILEVSAPRGSFTLHQGSEPVVLLSAGVGVTPVLAMLHVLVAEKSRHPVWWLYGPRNREEHPFREESPGRTSERTRSAHRIQPIWQRLPDTEADKLGEGGAKQKFAFNAEAIRILNALEAGARLIPLRASNSRPTMTVDAHRNLRAKGHIPAKDCSS